MLSLKIPYPPGDCVALTAALARLPEPLHVLTSFPEVFWGNPFVRLNKRRGNRIAILDYKPQIVRSNQSGQSYLEGLCEALGAALGLELDCSGLGKPLLYPVESDLQVSLPPKPYLLISAGLKRDFPLKAWPVEHYQAVVDALRDEVCCVQVGRAIDLQPTLDGVLSLVGKTSLRELIVLARYAVAGLGPSTLLQHLCAAWSVPYVCLLGGREAVSWQGCYPTQTTLHTIGELPCCKEGGCYKREVKRCLAPCFEFSRPVGQCMAEIRPDKVATLLRSLV